MIAENRLYARSGVPVAKTKKYDRIIEKVNLLLANKMVATPKSLEILDELWDEQGSLHDDRVTEMLAKVKNHQERLEFTKRKIMNEVASDVRHLGLLDDEFNVAQVQTNGKGRSESSVQITFRLKGNKKIIEHLENKGWVIDRRYKNDDGDPSIWSSVLHGKNTQFKAVMIVLKSNLPEE